LIDDKFKFDSDIRKRHKWLDGDNGKIREDRWLDNEIVDNVMGIKR
jgi:hypothetical protein